MVSCPDPLVSVLIPAHNSARYLPEAIESVLGQGYRPLEVVVVDDGSRDATREVCGRYPQVRYVYQENAGPAAARNTGIRLAAGPYVAFLDADDMWPEGKLAVQVELMERHRGVALLSGDMQRFSSGGVVAGSMFQRDGFDRSFFGDDFYVMDAYRKMVNHGNHIPTGTALLRKACLEKTGLFDERFRRCEDLDLWLRLALHYELAYSSRVWLLRRDHGANLTADSASMTFALIEVLEKHEGEYEPRWRAMGIEMKRVIAERRRNLGYGLLHSGRISDARRQFRKSLGREFRLRTFLCWSATCLGPGGVRWAQRLRQLTRTRAQAAAPSPPSSSIILDA